jgi:hypothetical protein
MLPAMLLLLRAELRATPAGPHRGEAHSRCQLIRRSQPVVTICNGKSDVRPTDPGRLAPTRRMSPHRDIKWAG